MRTPKVACGLALSVSALAVTGVAGQTAAGEAPAAFCWQGQALPACRGFVIFELEGAWAVASTTVVHESSAASTEYPVFRDELKWHLGAMRNVSEDWALGATLSLGTGSPGPLTGIRVRARRWLRPPMSAELELGAVDTGINDRFGSGSGWGPTFGARLNMRDQVSVFARWEGAYAEAGSDTYFEREAGFHQGLYVGASAGSMVALGGTVVLGAVALWIAYALSQSDF